MPEVSPWDKVCSIIRDDRGMTLGEVVLGLWLGLIISTMVVGVTLMTVRLTSYGSQVNPADSNPVISGLGRSSSTIQAPPRCANPASEQLRSQCLVLTEGTSEPLLVHPPSTAAFTTLTTPTPLCWVTLPASDISVVAAEDPRRLECWHFDDAQDVLFLSVFLSTLADAKDRLSLETSTPGDWDVPTARTLSVDLAGVAWECYATGDVNPSCAPGDEVSVVEVYVCLASGSRRTLALDAHQSMCSDMHPGKFPSGLQGEPAACASIDARADMTHRQDEGFALIESILAILVIGVVVTIVGLSVVTASRSISSAQKHSHATALLARYASVAQGVDCAAAAAPVACDPPLGWPPPQRPGDTTSPLGREVTGETTERGTVYTVEWSDDYEAPHGRGGNVRSRREVSVAWQDFGLEVTRFVEVLGPPPDDPDGVAWLVWSASAPLGAYCQIPPLGSMYEEIVGPQGRGGGEWLVTVPGRVALAPTPGGGCLGLVGLADVGAGGRCEDDPDPRWTVDICPN